MYAQMALQLLEKDIHEKQDSLVALRKQLEELKAANIKMQSQLKVGCISPCLSFPHCLYFPTLSLPPPLPHPLSLTVSLTLFRLLMTLTSVTHSRSDHLRAS